MGNATLQQLMAEVQRLLRRDRIVGDRVLKHQDKIDQHERKIEEIERAIAELEDQLADTADTRALYRDLLGQIALLHERQENVEFATGTRTYSCSYCGAVDDHYAPTCPHRRRCSGCGRPGHNIRTCQDVRRCGACRQPGHNIRTCSLVGA